MTGIIPEFTTETSNSGATGVKDISKALLVGVKDISKALLVRKLISFSWECNKPTYFARSWNDLLMG